MHRLDATHLQAAAACLAACAALGACAPRLMGRLPEPTPEPETTPAVVAASGAGDRKLFERTLPPRPPKELYADIAALPHLSLWLAACSAVVGAAIGLALGWTGALVYLVVLVPVGVVLVVIDWRTTLLPTRILHPAYALLAVLIPVAAVVDHDLDSLQRAGWGWVVIGGWFWIFWWLFTAWGFGDVRLSRVLGPALGYLGWSQLLVGLALMLFVGAIGGLVIGLVRGNLRGRVPYGPAMLVGALLAVLFGPWLATSLGY